MSLPAWRSEHGARGPAVPSRCWRAERCTIEELLELLVGRLEADRPPDPFQQRTIAVPSRGIERWLTQRLSHRLGAGPGRVDGVTAGLRFPFPGGIVQEVVAAALGEPADGGDPWSPERLVWPIVALLDDLPTDAVLEPLRAHRAGRGSSGSQRRYGLARRIADLFDRYVLHRPAMIAAWRDGHDLDAAGTLLPARYRWQPWVWRSLEGSVDAAAPDLRWARALAALERGEPADPGRLPEALHLFAVLGLPAVHVRMIEALSTVVPVSVYGLVPSASPSARTAPRHPLLAADAVQARRAAPWSCPADTADPPASTGAGLLAELQAAIRRDLWPPRAARAHDDSLQIHATHGPLRQLEVLRTLLYETLAADPSLEPRDIAVFTPDIARFAPLVPAVFPTMTADEDPSAPPPLPVRVVDRSLAMPDTATVALQRLLAVAQGRITASEILELLALPPVLAGTELREAELRTVASWLEDTGVSWGIDGAHRREVLGLDDDAHTFAAALDRLVLGASMPDDGRVVDGILPYDAVEGGALMLLGRLVPALEGLLEHLRALRAPRPLRRWVQDLTGLVDDLFSPGTWAWGDEHRTAELAALRTALSGLADQAGSDPVLELEEIEHLVGDTVRPTTGGSAAGGSGTITFSGPVPLHNVPHRVVCLVGLDEGALPRPVATSGLDLLDAGDQPGDPDPRAEERQVFLDAVLAARQRLIITYSGHDPVSGARRAPATVVAELLDVLGTVLGRSDGPAGDPGDVVVHHPLQAHSPRYFQVPPPGHAELPRPFDPGQLAAARALTAAVRDDAPLVVPLPATDDGTAPQHLTVDEVVTTLRNPVRAFHRHRLGLVLREDRRNLSDRDPSELDGLTRWQLADELLAEELAGGVDAGWQERVLARGTVPVGGPGLAVLEEVREDVAALLAAVGTDGAAFTTADLAIGLELPPVLGQPAREAVLTGTVPLDGDRVLQVSAGRAKPSQLLTAWVRLLGVVASPGSSPVTAMAVGRGDRGGASVVRLDPRRLCVADDREPTWDEVRAAATDHLAMLVAHAVAMREQPIPLLPETAAAVARARHAGKDRAGALAAAERSWAGGYRPGECEDDDVVQAIGQGRSLREVAEHWPLAEVAERLWCPLVAAEDRE